MNLLDFSAANCEAAFQAWRAGSGPLLPYVRSTPFVSLARYPTDLDLPDLDTLAPVSNVSLSLASEEAVIIDLPSASCLQIGLLLAKSHALWPVLTFSHWFHPHGAVGNAAAISLLLKTPPQIEHPVGYSLLLDAERYTEAPLSPTSFNNQYELIADDLPTADEWRALQIKQICLITTSPLKEDLGRYIAYLESESITVRWHK